MKLPVAFEERIQALLGDEYPAFRTSLEDEPLYGLRINTLKISVEEFLEITPFKLKPIPWVSEGFYFPEDQRPAKHPYYHAGLYYIQEPSAMAPGALIAPEPGDVILDTCAAPGGKTCQMAAEMKGEGVLVTNDISATRAKALLHNIEISGVKNAIVVCENPPKIAEQLRGCFNRILVDAPCSGEGMFRKTGGAIKAWDENKQEIYREMQEPILEAAVKMLKNEGVLVYSTCTFNRLENEDMVYSLLKEHSELHQDPKLLNGIGLGYSGLEGEMAEALYRIWPHKAQGEGHFLSRLVKHDNMSIPHKDAMSANVAPPECFLEFVKTYLTHWEPQGNYMLIGERLLLVPEHTLDLKGLRILRTGWYLGDVKKGRFEPAQAFAMGLLAEQFIQRVEFDAQDPELERYLKGETLHVEAAPGWNLVCVDGYPLGWAKGIGNMLKNHYPASWRRMD